MDGNNPRELLTTDRHCYRCGTTWRTGEITCPECGGLDASSDVVHPTVETDDRARRYPGPWEAIPWPEQGAVAMFGPPGIGKSSLSSLIDPGLWATKEQKPKPVAAMFRRLRPGFIPSILPVGGKHAVAQVAEQLAQVTQGPVVLDSLTAFGLQEALVLTELLIDWAHTRDDRALAIIQVNKAGQAAGYMELMHAYDAIIGLDTDTHHLRTFGVQKSRWCSLDTYYWGFDRKGRINIPTFDAAYSVEGNPGSYYLHPYPIGRATWAGLLDVLDTIGILTPKVASAAHVARYMPNRFLEPSDVEERRAFAERYELTWLSPGDWVDQIKEHEEREQEEKPRRRRK